MPSMTFTRLSDVLALAAMSTSPSPTWSHLGGANLSGSTRRPLPAVAT